MNRRELLATLAATAIAGEALLHAEPAAAADATPMMGSSVFEWDSIPVKKTAVGESRQFFDTATVSLEHFELHATTLNPGQMPHPPHKHPNEEMMIIRQGTLEVMQAGEYKHAGPGAVIFNASNVMHGLKNVGTEPAIYHVINWKTAATPAG